jgi:hypothetical protein
MNALFSASYEPRDMPPQNKHVLGVSSLWSLLLVHHWALHGNVPLAALLACVCAVSTVFWASPEWGSGMHKADKVFSWAFAVAMISSSGDVDKTVLIPVVLCVLAFFLLSDTFFRMDYHVMQLLAHLLFRYFFYVWGDILSENTRPELALVTLAYAVHAVFVYFFVDFRYYTASCAGLLLSIGAIVFIE